MRAPGKWWGHGQHQIHLPTLMILVAIIAITVEIIHGVWTKYDKGWESSDLLSGTSHPDSLPQLSQPHSMQPETPAVACASAIAGVSTMTASSASSKDETLNPGLSSDPSSSAQADPSTSVALESLRVRVQPLLSNYREWKSQIVPLSEETRIQRESLLKNKEFISALKDLLNTPLSKNVTPPSSTTEVDSTSNLPLSFSDQLLAVDYLVESYRSGQIAPVEEVFRSVIQSPTIENSDINPDLRKNLGAIKSELIFHWTALQPGVARDIASLSPGPVTQKIWQNVTRFQEKNLALSAEEAGSRTGK